VLVLTRRGRSDFHQDGTENALEQQSTEFARWIRKQDYSTRHLVNLSSQRRGYQPFHFLRVWRVRIVALGRRRDSHLYRKCAQVGLVSYYQSTPHYYQHRDTLWYIQPMPLLCRIDIHKCFEKREWRIRRASINVDWKISHRIKENVVAMESFRD
jgi:uncharacterized protein (DUF427 family)